MAGLGEEYLQACRQVPDEIQKLTESFMGGIHNYNHGRSRGHDRTHGSPEKEDMFIPLICIGPGFLPRFPFRTGRNL